MAGKIYNIEGNYIKIAMYSDYSSVHKGFKAYIGNGELKEEIVIPNGTVFSNEIQFEYTRTYIHPWKYKEYFLTKTAEKIKSYDGLADNASDYIWVKYLFKNPSSGILTESYPYIYVDYENIEIHDNFPEECVVYGYKGNLLTPTNNTYIITEDQMSTEYTTYTIYVGYPKLIITMRRSRQSGVARATCPD